MHLSNISIHLANISYLLEYLVRGKDHYDWMLLILIKYYQAESYLEIALFDFVLKYKCVLKTWY